MATSEFYIEQLNLQKHPEGGFFYETFSAKENINKDCLPDRFTDCRKHYTSIYFLLNASDISHFHRIKSDEIWSFHDGEPIDIHVLDNDGNYNVLKLGLNIVNGERPQHMVPAGVWFGATVNSSKGFSLVGCFVAPGFHFDDFEMAKQEDLINSYPKHRKIIEKLTN